MAYKYIRVIKGSKYMTVLTILGFIALVLMAAAAQTRPVYNIN